MYEEVFQAVSEENHYRDLAEMQDHFRNIVTENELENQKLTLLTSSLVSEYINKIAWEEIAEQYV